MVHAAIGISRLAAARAAGEEAALEALVRCESARYLILFTTSAHAASLGDVVNGARTMASDIWIAACAGHGVIAAGESVAEEPAVVALAVGGEGFLLREAQARRGPAEGTALARELGAPRDVRAIVVLPGPEVGDAEAVAQAIAAYSGSAITTVVAAPGSVLAIATAPYTRTMAPDVEPGGSFAWLMAGTWQLACATAPWQVPADASWSWGLYFGSATGDAAADLVAIQARCPDVPIAGLVGAARPDGVAFLLLFGSDAG